MKRITTLGFLCGFMFCSVVGAENLSQHDRLPDWMKLTSGIVSNINLSQRTLNVDAIRYLLPSATAAEPLQVNMLGSNYGSLELLQDGMAVSVYYRKAGSYRSALRIVQIEKSSEI
ncbi:MAG: hypothetical protein ABGY96_10925 [bacterium]|nr:hypothetical protein [Gammaproteobacteria bacterium]HIL96544.1 hypothetical protein [Pseudomonadales bacterium]